MGHFINLVVLLSLSLTFCLLPHIASAQLRQNYYNETCPNVEQIVRAAVTKKFNKTFVTVPATIRLFFHDCFVQGCDASILIDSTGDRKAEKDSSDNQSLAGDGFDTVIKAKEAVDAVPGCKNKVSCADILAMATRDVIALAGGPSYAIELGRLDGLSSTAASVDGKLPRASFDLNQLNSLFAANGLNQTDMIALSGAHTVGFSHCSKFANRIYNFSSEFGVDPTLNKTYAAKLQEVCPRNASEFVAITMDPNTPTKFDNVYYQNLEKGQGLFTSDQVLFTDLRSRPTVNAWATDSHAFEKSFVEAITKLGRVGVKTGKNGNIRKNCAVFN